MNILDVLIIAGLTKSKSEGRRAIKQRSVKIIKGEKVIIVDNPKLELKFD